MEAAIRFCSPPRSLVIRRAALLGLLLGLASCASGSSSDDRALDDIDLGEAQHQLDRGEEAHEADGAWTRLATCGSAPSERSTPAVAAIGRSIYVFGGVRDDVIHGDVELYSDLHRFDTRRQRWDVVRPVGAVPAPRAFAAAVGHPESRQMLMFGGAFFGPFFSDFSPYDDLWAYSADDNAWTEVHPVNAGPAARSRPSAWLVDDKMYVFGGVTSSFEVRNDLWVYDLATNAWTELIANAAAGSPPPRHEALAGTHASRGRLVIYGGESIDEFLQFTTLSDTWEYELATGSWTNVTPEPAHDIAPPRNYGSAAIIGKSLVVQGGDIPGGTDCGGVFPQNPTAELWRFDVGRRQWQELSPVGDTLVRLKRTNAAQVGRAMYVFGGFDFVCESATSPHQIWNHDVYRFSL